MEKERHGGTLLSRQIRRGVVLAALTGLLSSQAAAQQPGLFIDNDGKVGIGRQAPIAPLDVSGASPTNKDLRSGAHPRSVSGLYVTGDFPEGSPDEGEAPGVEFRHQNGWQGIGFGYNTIYATGSAPDQDLNLKPRGTGKVIVGGPLAATEAITGLGAVPVGAIMMWSGALDKIPDGWRLCDGENGTPDLKGRFIVGYHPNDPDYNSIKAGARTSDQKSVEIPSHRHTLGHLIDVTGKHDHSLQLGVRTGDASASGKAVQNNNDMNARGQGMTAGSGEGSFDTRPPYFVLAFIQYKGTHTAGK